MSKPRFIYPFCDGRGWLPTPYALRVRQLIEDEELTNSDAQAIADHEGLDDFLVEDG